MANYQNMPQYRGMDGYAEYLSKQANPYYRESYTPRHDPVVNDSYWASEAGYNMSQRDPDNSLQSAYDSYAARGYGLNDTNSSFAQGHGMNDNTDARLLALQQEKASLEKEIATLQREVNRMQSDVDFAKKYADDPLYKAAVETYVRTGNMGDLNTFRQYQDALAQRGQAERTNRETWLAKYGAAQRTINKIQNPDESNWAVWNAAWNQRDEAERQLRLMGIDPSEAFAGKTDAGETKASADDDLSVAIGQYSAKIDGLKNASEIDKVIKEIEGRDDFKSGGAYKKDVQEVLNKAKNKKTQLEKAAAEEADKNIVEGSERAGKWDDIKTKYPLGPGLKWQRTDRVNAKGERIWKAVKK